MSSGLHNLLNRDFFLIFFVVEIEIVALFEIKQFINIMGSNSKSESHNQVKHDFLGIQLQPQPQPQPQLRLDRRESFRGISKMNPEIVRSVLAGQTQTSLSSFHILSSSDDRMTGKQQDEEEAAPMTIFYKGIVTLVHLPKDKVEMILKFVGENCHSKTDGTHLQQTTCNDGGDMSMKRKKSLHRFFEKRKLRLVSLSPVFSWPPI